MGRALGRVGTPAGPGAGVGDRGGAVLHRDETTAHVLAVPIDEQGKLRWKGVKNEALDRLGIPRKGRRISAIYRHLQDDYHAQVAEPFGLARGEVGSKATHCDINRALAVERRVGLAEARHAEADAAAEEAERKAQRAEDRKRQVRSAGRAAPGY